MGVSSIKIQTPPRRSAQRHPVQLGSIFGLGGLIPLEPCDGRVFGALVEAGVERRKQEKKAIDGCLNPASAVGHCDRQWPVSVQPGSSACASWDLLVNDDSNHGAVRWLFSIRWPVGHADPG